MIQPKNRIKNLKPSVGKNEIEWRLKLDENENVYGASKFAISALRNFPAEKMALYPNYEKYKEKLADIYGLAPNKLLFANGTDSAIALVINTYLDNEEKIISNNSAYEKLASFALGSGGDIELIEFGENYDFNIDKAKEKLNTKAKICYLSTPNDMTGEVVRPSLIRDFLNEYPETLFVVDISNIGFAENVTINDYTDMIEDYSNVIIIKSFANDYALAGLGICTLISNVEVINTLKILSPDYTVSEFNLNCLICAINDKKYLEEIKKENAIARENLHKGLVELNFKPIKSEADFILCDFGAYCEFYYNKLKNQGVITKEFKFDSNASDCLRITVPKLSGTKYILQLLKPKNMLILAFEDTLFNVKKSYNEALIKTFEHFANHSTTIDKIKEIKRLNGYDFFNALRRLLSEDYVTTSTEEIKSEFNSIFYESTSENREFLIDYDELLIKKEILEKLSVGFDMVLVGLRSKEEMLYSLKKYNLEKYFSYIENASQMATIADKLPHKELSFIVANEEILSLAKSAGIRAIALVAGENNNNDTINNLKHFGADNIIYEYENILKFFELLV